MLKNASIGQKLIYVVAIPLIAMILISLIAILGINSTFNDMENKIKKQNYEAISLVLNADRDMYQAMLALKQVFHESPNAEAADKNKKTLESNMNEANDRTTQARAKFPTDDKYWGQHRDKNGKLISNYFDDFKAAFDKWKTGVTGSVAQNRQDSYDNEFTAARDNLNLIGEMIDEATNEIININKQNEKRLMTIIIIINSLIFIGIILLSYKLVRMISTPVRELTGFAERISKGDTDVNLTVDSKDEIGRLKKAFADMVEDIKLKTTAASEISQGNLDTKVVVRSDSDILSLSMENLRNTLSDMVKDINVLTQAALDGELSKRVDAGKHQGEFKRIVNGINMTLDAIVEPVNEVSEVMENISKGNLSVTVHKKYKGDYAMLADSVNKTVLNLKGIIGEIAGILEQMADGVLDMQNIREYEGDYSRISDSINSIIEALNGLVGDIMKASDQVATGSRQVSEGSMQLSQGATEQASSIEELSASITQMAGQTKMNATNAAQANKLAFDARDSAVKGNERMKDMLTAMEDINNASENISKIIKVIDEIAFQTNILALNAAVEAARAGQHGKGFAVVAEEVRNLAARSADAANETTEFIETSLKTVESGMKIANETAASLMGIVGSSAEVANLVGDIATASNEQASAIAQVNLGIDQVSKVVQTNSATAEESAAASEELMNQAEILNENVSKFKLRREYSSFDAADNDSSFVRRAPRRKSSNFAFSKASVAKGKTQIMPDNSDFGKY